MSPEKAMHEANFCFESRFSSLDLALAWTVLLKDYAGSSNVSFFFAGPDRCYGSAERSKAVNLVIGEKAILGQLRDQIEEQLPLDSGAQAISHLASFQTHLSISHAEYETPISDDKLVEQEALGSNNRHLQEARIDLMVKCTILDQDRNIRVTVFPKSAASSSSQAFRVLQQFGEVLHQIQLPASGSVPVYSIRTASRSDLHDVWHWNSHVRHSEKRTALDVFLDHVKHGPNAIAVNAWDGDITYQDLDELSTT